MQHAFRNTEFDNYDPHFRFSRYQDSEYKSGVWLKVVRWTDEFSRYRHMDSYTIHEWLPDMGPVSKKTFGFDVWFKRKIAAERPSCSTVKQWIQDWRTSLESDQIPAELLNRFEPEDDGYQDDGIGGGDKKEWIAQYGSRGLGRDIADISPQPEYAWKANSMTIPVQNQRRLRKYVKLCNVHWHHRSWKDIL